LFYRAVLLRLEKYETADVPFAVPFVYAVAVRSEAQSGAVAGGLLVIWSFIDSAYYKAVCYR